MTTYFASPSMRYLRERFVALYGEEAAGRCLDRLAMMVGRYGVGGVAPRAGHEKWSQRDAVLITYADMVRDPARLPLCVLKDFADRRLRGAFSTIHVLPFFPSSSDDGFSVIHYRKVDPDLGTWEDVRALGEHFQLMVDMVLNHVSSHSNWFDDFRTGTAPGRDYFIEGDPSADLSGVVRPRTHPLLTPVHTRGGERHVWTTFSADQVDLNYANPDVLFEILDLILYYTSMGARMFRLDAIAYLWKQAGTPCIHLPQTFEIVRLLREFLRVVAPDGLLLAETNVPHEENLRYFGNGDAAHLVYQFPLPPLLLDALLRGDSRWLSAWVARLAPLPAGCTFLNFTASHDGIGVRPLLDLVPAEHVQALAGHIRRRGGAVSMKRDRDGGESPYELNCTWFDAVGRENDTEDLHMARFLCSQTIPLALQGIPAVYFHSLTATPNDLEEVRRTGRPRSINRGRWDRAALEASLSEGTSVTSRVFEELRRRLAMRSGLPALHPNAAQKVLQGDPRLFGVVRIPGGGHPPLLALANLTAGPVAIPAGALQEAGIVAGRGMDALAPGGGGWTDGGTNTLAPYQCAWFTERLS